MNTTTAITASATVNSLPKAFSSVIQTFETKEQYLTFRKDWKLVYRHITELSRIEKANTRGGQNSISAAKSAHYDQIIEGAKKRLAELAPISWKPDTSYYPGWSINAAVTGNPKTKPHQVTRTSGSATWLLWYRREVKKLNAERVKKLNSATV